MMRPFQIYGIIILLLVSGELQKNNKYKVWGCLEDKAESSTEEVGLVPETKRQKNCSQSRCIFPWSYCGSGQCKCSFVPDNILQCNLEANLTVSNCNCATYDTTNHIMEAGMCIFNCGRTREDETSTTHTFPGQANELNGFLCEPWNRSGTLCGNCKRDHNMLAYSFDMNCVPCPHGKSNWWKYLLIAYLPLTIFYFVVLFFNINVTSSHLHGFVHYSQAVSMPALSRTILMSTRNVPFVSSSIRYIAALYGVWNLDFFRTFKSFGICLQLGQLDIIALDLAIGVYPLILMVVTYFLIHLYDKKYRILIIAWKPFYSVLKLFHKNWRIRTTLIDAFATFFLLSNLKFLSVSFDLLAPVKVYELNSTGHLTYSWRFYYNANILYLGEKHLPYVILAFAVLTLFVAFPILFIFVYPFRCFQKFLNLFPGRWYILHTFMDAFQGCYKDGTQPGTRDYRWFASTFFIFRILALLMAMMVPNVAFFFLASMIVIIFAILIVNSQPFKSNLTYHSNTNAIFTILLALLFVCFLGNERADEISNRHMSMVYLLVAVCVAIGPLIYISVIIFYWLYAHRKFGIALIEQLRTYT